MVSLRKKNLFLISLFFCKICQSSSSPSKYYINILCLVNFFLSWSFYFIIKLLMLQTSFLRKFPSINFVDWSPAFVSNSFGLKNNFTGDLFTYENLDTHSKHMVEIYKQRAQYVMPNTPQIMLSQTDSKSNTLEMLVENGPYSIDRLVKKCDESTFRQLLFNVSKTV